MPPESDEPPRWQLVCGGLGTVVLWMFSYFVAVVGDY
jgi:hypothetical protein